MSNKVNRSVSRPQVIRILLTVLLVGTLFTLMEYMLQETSAHAGSMDSLQTTAFSLSEQDAPPASPSAHSARQQSAIVPGSVFTFAMAADAAGLDPAQQSDLNSFMVTSQIYETLVDIPPNSTIPSPGLAVSWSVSSNGLTWTFTLRSGIKFHDGTDLDAAAVVYNFQRWWDPAHPYHDGTFTYFEYVFKGFRGDPGCLISDVSAPSAYEVQIVLSETYGTLPSALTMPALAIASPTAIQAGTLMTTPVGSGPFEFVEWQGNNYIQLTGDPDYWGGSPYLDSLVFQVIADDNARFAALQANSVQGALDLGGGYVTSATLDADLQVVWRPPLNTGYLGINQAHSPLGNSLVREAIAHAIDKQHIIDNYYDGIGIVAEQFLPPDLWGYNSDLVDYDYDPAEAQSLLALAGYPDGFTTTLWVRDAYRIYFPEIHDIAAAIAADLQAVGITATQVVTDPGIFIDRVVNNGEADLFLLGWIADFEHPDNFFTFHFCDDSNVSFGPRDTTLCTQLDAARDERDFDTQVGMYEWASQRVHDTLPAVPVGHGRDPVFLRHNVTGFTPSATGGESFQAVYARALTITKSAPASVMSGDPITYSLVVTNVGDFDLTGVIISDTLPTGAHYLSGGTLVGDVVVWSGLTISAGNSVQVSFAVTSTDALAVNDTYTADCAECVPAHGTPVVTIIGGGRNFAFAMAADAVGLDPAQQSDLTSFMVTSQIYETLFNIDSGSSLPEPGLADSWSISADGLTWTFFLRSGIKFHDGTNLDAAAVVYNFQRWWDPAHPYHDGTFTYFEYLFGGFKGDPGCLISDISAPSAYEVRIVLSETYGILPSALTMPALAIASPTAIQAGTLMTTPVGSGPFEFVEWLGNNYIRLAGDPNYWGGSPYLDTLVFQVIADDDTRFAALQANDIQGAVDLGGGYVTSATMDFDLRVVWRPPLNTGYLGINQAHSPFSNSLVREAIAHAIDKQHIIDNYYDGIGIVAEQFLPPDLWGYNSDLVDYDYDPAEAQSLLTLAGYPDGFTTTLWVRDVYRIYFPEIYDIAAAVAADLQAVGITATQVVTDPGIFIDRVVNNGEADLFLLGWVADFEHPDNFFTFHFCDDSNVSFGPQDSTLCNQLEAARDELNFDTQVGMYEWVSQRVHDTLPMVPIGHGRDPVLLRHNVVGFSPSGNGGESFKDVYLEVLTIHKSARPSAVSGDPITYTLEVGNVGDFDLTGVVISDTLPAGAHYLSGGTLVGDDVVWSGVTISTGQSIGLRFAVTATTRISNHTYGASYAGYVPARGSTTVETAIGTASVVVGPATGGAMVDTSSPGVSTTVQVPAGAVNADTQLIFYTVPTPTGSPTPTFSFAGHAFSIDAYVDDELVHDLFFLQPVTLTIEYEDSVVAGLDESTLTLTYWNGSEWSEDGITVIERDLDQNRLVVTISHLTEFAMFGTDHRVYLPLVMRES